MQPVTSNQVRSEKGVYLPLTIGRRKCLALIDTGSETTPVSHSLVQGVQLSPSDQHLQAANGSEIVIKGEGQPEGMHRGASRSKWSASWWRM